MRKSVSSIILALSIFVNTVSYGDFRALVYCTATHPKTDQKFLGAVVIHDIDVNLAMVYCQKWAEKKGEDAALCKIESCSTRSF